LHYRSEDEARYLRERLALRLRDCGLEMHPTKTRVVYCKDSRQTETHEQIQFDFLGYTFRPRRKVSRNGRFLLGFTPAVGQQRMTAMRQSIRRWHLTHRSELSLDPLAQVLAPRVRGWVNCYCRFRCSEFQPVADHLDRAINFVTPAQRHQGVDAELLTKREAVYERAKSLNPRRWSGDIRNWEVAGAVSLNPGKLQEIERNKQAA